MILTKPGILDIPAEGDVNMESEPNIVVYASPQDEHYANVGAAIEDEIVTTKPVTKVVRRR